MKYVVLCISLLCFGFSADAQCFTTYWLNPKPAGNALKDVFMISPDTVYAGGERGTVVRTFDGGANWELIDLPDTWNITSLWFTSASTGIATAVINNHSVIYKTTNYGMTWTMVYDGYQMSQYGFVRNLQFTSADTGYAYFKTGTIIYTFNGGDSWSLKSATQAGYEGALFFLDNNKGFVSTSGAYISRTLNAGQSWTVLPISGNMGSDKILDIHFSDSLHGYAITDKSKLVTTTDGGNTWNYNPTQVVPWFGNRIYFTSIDTGFVLIHASSSTTHLYRTVDTGNTWQSVILPNASYADENAISFVGSTGYIVSDLASLYKTTDLGATWTDQSSGSRSSFYGIEKASDSTLFVAGSGEVLKSTNRGESWTQSLSVSSGSFYGLFFLDSLRGWAVGSSGLFRKTTNGGQTWTNSSTSFGSSVYYTVYFIDSDTGFVGGPGMRRSTNGGQTWSNITGISGTVRDIHFINKQVGFAVGASGLVLRTLDGGVSWNTLPSFTTKYLLAVRMLNDSTVVIGGSDGNFFRSTDTGSTWITTTPGWGDNIQALHFENELEGYMLQSDFNGIIYRTVNGGLNWTFTSTPSNGYLFDLTVYGNDIYVVGMGGKIIKIANEIQPPIVAPGVSRCDSGLIMITATSPYTVRWFDGPDNFATQIGEGDTFTYSTSQNQVIYAEAYDSASTCISTKKPVAITITAPAVVTVMVSASKDTICPAETVTLTASSSASTITNYQWFKNGFTVGSGDSSYTPPTLLASDSFWVEIQTSDYCVLDSVVESSPKQIYISTAPTAGFAIDAANPCLKGNSFVFRDTSKYVDPLKSLMWTISDGSSSANPVFNKVFAQSGNFNVKLVTENIHGCKDSSDAAITVYTDPVAAIGVNELSQCLLGHQFDLSDSTTYASPVANRIWYFSDTTTFTAASFSKFFSASGAKSVQLIVEDINGCKDTNSLSLIIHPDPVAKIAVDNPEQCFKDHVFLLVDSSTIDPGYTLTTSWDFDDGNLSSQPVVNKSYTAPGSYTISLTSTSNEGCITSDTQLVTVFANPITGDITGDTLVNKGSTYSYAVPGSASSTYAWFIENGSGSSTGNSINITWADTGKGVIKVVETDVNGCVGDTVIKQVTVGFVNGIVSAKSSIEVYPIPAGNWLTIRHNTGRLMHASVFDALGNLVLQLPLKDPISVIEVKHLPAGFYHLVLLENNQSIYTHKVIIVR